MATETPMQLGMVGLGRMGANMVQAPDARRASLVVYDVQQDAVAALEQEGATGASSLEDLIGTSSSPAAGDLGHGPAAPSPTRR